VDYLLFTYPNCPKCDAIKKILEGKELKGKEYNLVMKESKLKIREFLKILNRDDKGGIIIPTLVIRDSGEVVAVLNERKELEDWLPSKD
jgi:glutaredoxin